MGRKPGERLPNSSRLRLVAITERSASDPERPKMDEETEKRLHRVEVESAACYADMEDAAQRFWMLSEILDEEHEAGFPDQIEEEPSVAHRLDELSLQLKASES